MQMSTRQFAFRKYMYIANYLDIGDTHKTDNLLNVGYSHLTSVIDGFDECNATLMQATAYRGVDPHRSEATFNNARRVTCWQQIAVAHVYMLSKSTSSNANLKQGKDAQIDLSREYPALPYGQELMLMRPRVHRSFPGKVQVRQVQSSWAYHLPWQ